MDWNEMLAEAEREAEQEQAERDAYFAAHGMGHEVIPHGIGDEIIDYGAPPARPSEWRWA